MSNDQQMSKDQTAKPYSFWELLGEYAIQIPRIQRDYAQGRSDPKTKEVREGFVTDLADKLLANSPLNLDFVYGTVEKSTLTLLDGQQRLTTLFLLYWYVAMQAGKLEEAKERLKKFSYDTRFSSRDFCKKLVSCSAKSFAGKEDKPSIYVQDQPWFFAAWKKNPTVAGMLVVLDEIHAALGKGSDWCTIWKRLVGSPPESTEACAEVSDEATASTGSASACPIAFQFLNMGNFGLTDELYIKMNARGKSLTDFEHFKAWLQEKHRKFFDDQKGGGNNLYSKFDNAWTDIFWGYRDEENRIDEAYLRFFQGVALNKWLLIDLEKEKSDSKEEKEKRGAERTRLIQAVNRNQPLLKSDWEKLFGETDILTYTFDLLDKFANKGSTNLHDFLFRASEKEEHPILFYFETETKSDKEAGKEERDQKKSRRQDLFRRFVESNASYERRALFFALCSFLPKTSRHPTEYEAKDKNDLRSWMRVMRNLVVNTDITDQNFSNILQTIRKLTELEKLYDGLKDKKGDDLTGFSQAQREEEIEKAQLITTGKATESLFLRYENHAYFRGQIGFLLEYGKDEKGVFDSKVFVEYAKKASVIFDPENKKEFFEGEFLFQRALLSKGDYTDYHKGCTWILNPDWRSWILSKRGKSGSNIKAQEARRNFHSILAEIGFSSLPEGLRAIIDQFLGSHSNASCLGREEAWRWYFVHSPALWESNNQNDGFSRPEKYINCHHCHNDFIYLLKSSSQVGYSSELRSYWIYKEYLTKGEILLPFTEQNYRPETGRDSSPFAYLNGWYWDGIQKKFHFNLEIRFIKECWEIRLFDQNQADHPEGIPSRILKKLEEWDGGSWEAKKHHGQICTLPEEADIVAKIISLCEALSKTVP